MDKLHFKLLLLLVFTLALSQIGSTQRTCGATEHQIEQLQNTDYAKWYKNYKAEIKNKEQRVVNCSNPLIIPIAVHYGGNINSSNPACLIDRALDQVKKLNEDFGGYNNDISNYCALSELCCTNYPPEVLSQGTCLQFCLSSQNHPSCEPATNLIGGYAITVGQHGWPTASNNCWKGYFNIFVSDVDPPGYMNLLGLAPIGGAANPDGNGMYITSSAFGGDGSSCTSGAGIDNNTIYNLGRTGTHEAGHYFGLDHIFDGCSDGDDIADTPDQATENFGCPTSDVSNCTSTSENTCGTQDFYFNYMDYVNDDCMYMFTEMQGQRMYNTALLAGTGANEAFKQNTVVCSASSQPQYNPSYPSGCILANPPIPDSAFEPTSGTITTCDNKPINFTNLSETCVQTGWSWTFSGAGVSVSSSTLENPAIYVTQSGTLNVTLTTSNSTGSDPTPATASIAVTVTDSNDPACNECSDIYTDTGGTSNAYGNNEKTSTTICAPLGTSLVVQFSSFDIEYEPNCMYDVLSVYDGPDDQAASIGNYCGSGLINAPGSGFINSTDECLTFVFESDVSVVADGWEAIVVCSVVVPLDLISFTAKAKEKHVSIEWKTEAEINLSSFVLERSMDGEVFTDLTSIPAQGLVSDGTYTYEDSEVETGTYYYRLRQIYLDDTYEYSTIISTTLNSKSNQENRYTVFPNPNNGHFKLSTSRSASHDLTIELFNNSASKISKFQVTSSDGIAKINLSQLNNGVYTMRIQDGTNVQVIPVVIVK